MTTRYVKPAGPTYGPVDLITVCVQGRPAVGGGGGGGQLEEWDTAAVCYSTFRDRKWRPAGSIIPKSGAELLDVVHGLARPRVRTYVVAPVASYALALGGAFVRWWEEGWKWGRRPGSAPEGTTPKSPGRPSAGGSRKGGRLAPLTPGPASDVGIVSTCILKGKPDIVRYSVEGKSLTWCSGHNWWPATEESIAATVGYEWSNPGERWRGKHPPRRSPRDRAMLWLLAMERLADWWRSIDGGPFAVTIAGLAMSYFRKRLAPKTLLSHDREPAREVEEKALFGGRCQTWSLAPYGPAGTRSKEGHAPPPASGYPRQDGPLEHWDVQAMYPTILAREEFPTKIWFTNENPPVAKVASDARHLAVIADVMIETDQPDYPARDGERVVWPVGRFRTGLAGPELVRALAAGHVVHCFRSVSYSKGRPFAAAAGGLLKLRKEAGKGTTPAWEMLVKSLSVAFGGKLAEIKHDWVANTQRIPLVAWGEFFEPSPATGRMTNYRAAGPLVWEQVPHKLKGRPLASCFCYLTAYGRDLMHQIRQLIPAGQLVSMDTDGVWVARPSGALFARARRLAADRGYNLRRTGITAAGQWYGPRHYWTVKGWILSGYHEPRRLARDLTFRDSVAVIPPATLEEGPPRSVRVTWQSKKLTTLPVDGQVGPDGWVTPRRVVTLLPQEPQPAVEGQLDTSPLPPPSSLPPLPSARNS